MILQVRLNGKDVSGRIEKAVWKGSIESAARSFEMRMAGGSCKAGDSISVKADGKTIFTGIVTLAERDFYTTFAAAADYGIYLVRNETYKEYKGTPRGVACQIAAEFGLDRGNLARKAGTCVVTSTGNMNAFAVLKEAYGVYGNRPKYKIGVEGRRIFAEAVTGTPVATLEAGLETAAARSSMLDMVNTVAIVDRSNGARLGTTANGADRRKYGTFRKNYRTEKGKNPYLEAKKLLTGTDGGGRLKAVGDVRCVSGKCVAVKEKGCGMRGKYIISKDRHVFAGGSYTMELECYEW